MLQKKHIVKSLEKLVPIEIIQNKIYLIRGRKVMLDKELAELYEVSTNRLKEQVRRNLKRFPSDFMFELTWEEASKFSSRPQFAGLKKGSNVKYLPYVFTEQGVAMLSSVLKSDRAIEVNIQIMRVFMKLKEVMISHKELAAKLSEIENRLNKNDKEIRSVFEAMRNLMSHADTKDNYKRTKICFIVESQARKKL